MRLIALLLLGVLHAADDMPFWVLPGILATETHSYYRTDGSICYVDRRTGAAGELSCFQITPQAFREIARGGETFGRIATDTAFAEALARRYLQWIYDKKANGDWLRAVGMYNAGFGTDRRSINRRIAYLNKVRVAGTRQ